MNAITQGNSTDPAFLAEPETVVKARPVGEYSTHELKQELLRRGFTDFSRYEWAIKLSPFLLLFIAATLWKFGQDNGGLLGCLFG